MAVSDKAPGTTRATQPRRRPDRTTTNPPPDTDTGSGSGSGDEAADLALWDQLQEFHARLSRTVEAELWRRHTLAPRQLVILGHLATAPGHRLALSTLSTHLALPTTNMSRLCGPLETRRLLSRHHHGQAILLALTETGASLTRAAEQTQLDCVRQQLAGRLTPDEATTLTGMLTRLNQP